MSKLTSKRALVTAGGQGIGLAISKHLIESGCDVCIHYFSSEVDCDELKQLSPRADSVKVCSYGADLCRKAEAQALVDYATKELGGLDILVNNAGSLVERRPLEEVDDELWSRVLDLNLSSMAWVTKAAAPHLAKAGQGSIVNLSSLAARNGGGQGALLYSTAKGAMLTWTRGLAKELGPKGIRVNAVAPGLILGTTFHETHTSKEAVKSMTQQIPVGRAGNPDDVARAVGFLAAEYDGFISGATLDINGGVYGV